MSRSSMCCLSVPELPVFRCRHVTQVSEHEVTRKDDPEDAKVEALRGVAPEGDQVWVKVRSAPFISGISSFLS